MRENNCERESRSSEREAKEKTGCSTDLHNGLGGERGWGEDDGGVGAGVSLGLSDRVEDRKTEVGLATFACTETQQCALIQYRDLTLKGHGRCFRPECGVEGVNPELKAEIGERGRGTWCDAPDHLRAILDGLLAMEGTLKRSNVVNSLCRA